MATSEIKNQWDAVAEEKKWRKSLATAESGQDQLEPKAGKPPSGFYVLCLAELDAAMQFTKPEFFRTREEFIAELKLLMIKPMMPSRPVPDVLVYQGAQKWWLEFLIKQYEEI
ncbi:MAG TPA: hypothetical protein VMA13_10875 [Candidatus Saccharimonadales bacterium]|nr:hypothetical protein [Candidatus Saccharimonadales bacterium]